MKTWNWKTALKAEAKLWWLEFCHQVFGYRISAIQRHILRERSRMTRSLWLAIMYRDRWQCEIKSPVCTGRAEQVDHVIALYNWGYTESTNLQAACAACNKFKGIK